ncbi:dihydrofolate reductase family protein [Corynebacterium sp. YIM 101645]|uniref:Dihydrofolate reductase family protein n=1 Tax=Corynebacterium lemuris TaxID=1859292 RepID=A0ABT2FUL4_9CORY|nr:dihydrofolate reductase family protein [Corynebacterium lemuris]MCS5478629.1 dihydrofolate reductase family protein [Corynebacterium lemuris]
MPIIYNAATTLNGFLADEQDSLQWLFDVPGSGDAEAGISAFLTGINTVVMGSTTYEWLLNHLESPQALATSYGTRPIWVFTSRNLPVHEGTHVRLVNGPVAEALPRIRETGENIWVMGGGDLAGQFFDAGALDRITLTVAPVFLPAGRPTLPRRIESSRLSLVDHRQLGQFVELTYRVR